MGSLRWRTILAAFSIVVALIYVLPSVPGVQDSALRRLLPANEISLGLDLKGGMHLTLGVDLDVAAANALTSLGQDLPALKPESRKSRYCARNWQEPANWSACCSS